jgi:hypothetical protein
MVIHYFWILIGENIQRVLFPYSKTLANFENPF